MKKNLLLLIILLLLRKVAFGDVLHFNVLSDQRPDLSSIEAFGRDIGDKWQTNNDKAIILNYWIDQLTTYSEPLYFSRQWDDPIAFLNNNEYGMCSDMTHLMNSMGEGAFGFAGRRHELSNFNTPIAHTVPEIEYDGKLHLFDPSFGFAYGIYDDGIVTSMADYAINPYFSKHNTPAALTRDTDGDGPIKAWMSYDNFGWSVDRFRYDEYSPDLSWIEKKTEGYFGVHHFDISIEDYEYYTRYWTHLDGLADFNPHDFYWPHYNYENVDDYSYNDDDFEAGQHRGNGLWVYTPNLSDANSFEESKLVTLEANSVFPSQLNTEGALVFKVDSANFVTGVVLEASINRATQNDSVIIEASSDGGNYWFRVWNNESLGDVNIKENISNMVKGTLKSQDLRHVNDFLVRVRLNSVSALKATSLKSMKIKTVTMLSASSLPKLKLGTNEITIAKPDANDIYQKKTFNPVLTKLENGINDEINWQNIEAWKLYAVDYMNLQAFENFGNMYTGLEKSSGDLGWVTYELDAPRDIKKASLGGSFIVRGNSDDKFTIKYRVFNGVWSTWSDVATYDWTTRNNTQKRDNQSHSETWDIAQDGVRKIQFKTEVYNYASLEALHMEVDYIAKASVSKPLYISYSWTEFYEDANGDLPQTANGGVTRTYKEKVTNLPHKFNINTGGIIQPRMNWVSMFLEGNEDPTHQVSLGYSDGVDKQNSDFIPSLKYDIEDIISINKPITLSVAPSFGTKEQLVDGRIIAASTGERGNQGGGKVEVQNDDDDIVKFSAGVGTIEAVIDLGAVVSVGGVRVDAFKQSLGDFFPDSITVESATVANQFTTIAKDMYKSAKYAHNLWPVQWSLPMKANSLFTGSFPNYGLLSNYIFVPFKNQVQARYIKIKIKEQNYKGQTNGVTLSEIHVYDKLTPIQWSPKLKHAKDMVLVDLPYYVPVVVPVNESIEIEAESGDISAPMVRRDDNKAFNQQYITNANGNGKITYTFEVQNAGVYKIWARAIAPDGASDSFFVKMDNGAFDIWDITNSNKWKWTKINARALGGEKSYNLSAGVHTFEVKAREGGAKLDKIVVTNDAAYVPSDPIIVQPVISTVEIEAESGALVAPMLRRDDNNAFNGKYITNDNGNGKVTYSFDVQSTGVYKIWARAIAPDGVSDSFFVKMDNGAFDIWDITNSNNWKWTKINGRAYGSVISYNLSAGTHTFEVKAREGGAKLDKLVITNDTAYVPSNPPVNGAVLVVEAENANLTHPMLARDDASASGGKYITNDNGSGSAEFTFNVVEAGAYKLNAIYIAPTGESDSFFVKMDNGVEDIWDMHPNTPTWKNMDIDGRNLGGDFVYNLSIGSHVFYLRAREGGAKVDKLTLVKQ